MSQKLHVGVAATTINPRMGMQIDGNIGVQRPARFVLNDLHARAIAFRQGEERFLLIGLELLAVTQEWTDAIRDFAADELGFPHDCVAVHAVQCHSAPSLGQIMLTERLAPARERPWMRGSDPDYGPLVMSRIKPMLREAAANMRPVHVRFGTALESGVSFNRRIAMRDGTSEMGLAGRPQDALYREGPSDPEVGVALFTTEDLDTPAALLHHTCHPVHWNPHDAVHSDWPGAWAERVREEMLPGVTPLVLNGCCGNVHHADVFNPGREDTPQSMARLLTDAVRRALEGPCVTDEAPVLASRTERFGIPWRKFPEGMFEDAHRFIEEHPEPTWTDETKTRFGRDWAYAASQLDLEQMMAESDTFEYEIQVVRIGDLAIVVLPGEPFVEGQLEIKEQSPFGRTFVAHMSNRYVGYIPTPEAIERGGYEVGPWGASKLAEGALQTIVDLSVAMLEGLR
ncbi:MAG: hypothetical protein ACQER1_17160 [Armatimonadota bacterium]